MPDKHEWARRLTHKIVKYTERMSVSNAAFCVLTQESDLLATMAEAIQSAEGQLRETAVLIRNARAGLKEIKAKIEEAQHFYEARQRELMEDKSVETEVAS